MTASYDSAGESLRVDAGGTLSGRPSLALRDTVATWREAERAWTQARAVDADAEEWGHDG